MGLSAARARDAAAVARRSPLALRRRLAISGARRAPTWAGAPSARAILAAVFAGGWNDRAEGDRTVLAAFAGVPYDELAAQLLHWAAQPDPPVRRIGDTWLIAAKEDAWRLLARYLTRADLERFRAIAVQVLTGADEQGQEPHPVSGFLADGLADTLALLGALGQTTRLADGSRAEETAARAVREILRVANADARIWIMNERRLPRLAEAAPPVFLDAVDAGLQGEQPVVMRMFGEEPGAMMPVSWQAGLLWALEVLAWPREYLGRAASALARLARLDPGGRTLNRPANSLREIFLVWYPQTAADLAFRQTVLERIIRDEPTVAWRLLRRLLPEMHGSASPTSRPRWRDWVPEEEPAVTYAEIFAAAEWTVEHLIGLAGTDGTRWAELIEHLENVPPAAFTRVVDHLGTLRPSRLGAAGKTAVWEALRALIAKHRRYPDAKWALPAEQVARLDPLYRRFAPGDVVERYAYLFGNAPVLAVSYGRRDIPVLAIKDSALFLGDTHRALNQPTLGVALATTELAQKVFGSAAESRIDGCVLWALSHAQTDPPNLVQVQHRDPVTLRPMILTDFRHTLALATILARWRRQPKRLRLYLVEVLDTQQKDGGWPPSASVPDTEGVHRSVRDRAPPPGGVELPQRSDIRAAYQVCEDGREHLAAQGDRQGRPVAKRSSATGQLRCSVDQLMDRSPTVQRRPSPGEAAA